MPDAGRSPDPLSNNFTESGAGAAGTTIRAEQGCMMLRVYACLTEQHRSSSSPD
jgi:hypothetical protein